MNELTRRRRARASAGFTLLELMVALTAGLIVVTSFYYMASASARHFQQQHRVANLQTKLRLAMDQIKRDVARAGFMATPNAAVDPQAQRCPTTNLPVAIAYGQDPTFASNNLNPTDNSAADDPIRADSLRLFGNFTTSDEYLIRGVSEDSAGALNSVYLQTDWHAFRSRFTDWWTDPPDPDTIDSDELARIFYTGAGMRIQTFEGNRFFVEVTDVPDVAAGTPPLITFTPSLPSLASPCFAGSGLSATVAPLGHVRYQLTADAPESLDYDETPAEGVAGTNVRLVREELEPYSTTVRDDRLTRTVLEYAAHFRVDFMMDERAAANLAPDVALSSDPLSDVAADPERVRAVIIDLAAREPFVDANFPMVTRQAGDPLRRFRPAGLTSGQPGTARVRRLRARVLVPNIAYPDLL